MAFKDKTFQKTFHRTGICQCQCQTILIKCITSNCCTGTGKLQKPLKYKEMNRNDPQTLAQSPRVERN